MLAIADRRRTLTDKEGAQFRHHLDGCEECRAIAEDVSTDWRWIARLPADALDGGDISLMLPMVDPIVFDIDQEIAKGGMGRITKALDRRLGRDVAVKEVLAEHLRARFEREAMITARLQHPAIVPIYEAGTFPNGNPFYTMRLVWGGTLGAAIHKTTTIRERIALLPHVLAVIDALAYAHDNRIIHRDLKPGNVLVGEFGETVVIDWGLAKELDSKIDSAVADAPPSKPSSPKLTRVGSVLGTPGFMSPEQASGGNLDERADVYALGAILYNLLAGVPPYWDKHATEGSTRLISIGLAQPPTPLAQIAPDAPADLRTICERAMARRKEDRYPSAKEMAAELRRFSAGQLISRAYTLRELIARWVRKHRTAVVITTIAAIALAVVAVVAFVNVDRSRRDEQEQRVKAQEAETIAQQGVASLLEEQGLRELLAGDSNRALTYLAGAFDKRDTPALRYLIAAASDDLDKDHYALESASAIAIMDGQRIVTVDPMRIVFWDGTRYVRSHPMGGDPILDAEFDPTRNYVGLRRAIANKRTRLEVWEVETGTKLWTIDDPAMDGAVVAFDRQGKRTVSYAGTKLQVHEIATKKPLALLDAASRIHHAAIGEHHVAACADDGVIYVWDVTALDNSPRRLRRRDAGCFKLAFLDSEQLVVANKNYELLRWPVTGAEPDRTMSGHIAINTIGVHVDKKRIATGDATGIVMWSFDGAALGESRDVQGGIDKLAFSPDGRSLVGAGADDRVLVWDVESFHLKRATSGGEGSIRGIAIADNKIATVGVGKSHVWAMPGGRLVHREPSHKSAISGDAWITATDTDVTVRQLSDGAERHRIPYLYEPVQLLAGAGMVVIAAKNGTWVLDLKANPPVIKPGPNRVGLVTTNRSRLLAIGDKRITIVDAISGDDIKTVPLEAQPLPIGDISADGRYVALVFPTAARVIDLETDRVSSTDRLPVGHTYAPRFDPTGAHLVLFGGTEPALIIDAGSGRQMASLKNTESADGLKLSRDGSRVAINIGNTVQVWNVTPTPDHSAGHYLFAVGSTIQHAYALSDDGRLFATGSIDGQIRIWDETGRLLDRLVGSQTGITWLAFAGDRLLAQADDKVSTIWDVHRDTRSSDVIKAFAADHSNWKLEGVRIVPKR